MGIYNYSYNFGDTSHLNQSGTINEHRQVTTMSDRKLIIPFPRDFGRISSAYLESAESQLEKLPHRSRQGVDKTRINIPTSHPPCSTETVLATVAWTMSKNSRIENDLTHR